MVAPAALTAMAASPAPAEEQDLKAGDGDEQAILKVDREFSRAVASHDMEGMLKLLSDDVISLTHNPDFAKAEGKEDIRKLNSAFFETTRKLSIDAKPSKVGISKSGDLAFVVGDYTSSFENKKGDNKKLKGRYVFIMKKLDGEWKIVLHAGNGNVWE